MIDYEEEDYEGVVEMFKEYGHLPGQPLEMSTESENPDDMEVYEPLGGMALPSQMFIWGEHGMKYAIISDIHGNLAAFKWTLADARKRGCEKIICLGDLTGYGKRSVECVELAMKEVDVCLMGNHDSACCGKENPLELIFNRNYDVDVATRDLLDRRQMAWLSERSYVMQGKGFACTHGEFTRPKEWGYIINPVDAWLSLRAMSEPILFVGHSHVPVIMKLSAADAKKAKSMDQKIAIEGLSGLSLAKARSFVVERGARYVVNAGSVGLPRMGSKATYVIYDDKAKSVDLIEVNHGRRKNKV